MLKEEERREREQAIYRAVLRLAGDGADISRLRVQEIAAEAGMGKGTVYEYFASKDEILQGMTSYCIDSELSRVEELLDRCTTLDRVEQAMTEYLLDMHRTRGEVYWVLSRALAAKGRKYPCTWSRLLRGRLEKCLNRMVERLQKAGEIDPALDAGYCVFVLISVFMMHAVELGVHDEQGPAAEAVSANARRMLSCALRPMPGNDL